MANLNKWNEMYQRFANHYSMTASNVSDWYPSGRNELTLIMSDKSRVIYNDVLGSIRTLMKNYEYGGMSESDWRRCFSVRLRTLMYEQRYTQLRLSEETGIAASTISNYLNEKSTPSMYAIHLLANTLQCSVQDLTNFEDR